MVVLALYILLIATIVLIGSVVIPPVVEDTEDLVRSVPDYVDDFEAWALTLPERFPFLPQLGLPDLTVGLPEQLQDLVAQLGSQFTGLLGQTLGVLRFLVGFLSGALNGIFVLVLALYITQDSERILGYLVGFMPQQRQAQTREMLGTIGDRLGGWLRGQIALSAIIGTVTFVGLSLIGVNYAVLLALIAAVGEAIPLIGPIISAVPAVIVAFFQSPLQGFLTLGLYILIQQLENNLIVPKVMERAVALHPLAVMVALLAGAELLGVTGAILSVPVAAAFSVVVQEVRRLQRQRDQQKSGLLEPGGGAGGAGGTGRAGLSAGRAAAVGPGTSVAPNQAEHDPGAAGHHRGRGEHGHHDRPWPASPGDQPEGPEVGGHAERAQEAGHDPPGVTPVPDQLHLAPPGHDPRRLVRHQARPGPEGVQAGQLGRCQLAVFHGGANPGLVHRGAALALGGLQLLAGALAPARAAPNSRRARVRARTLSSRPRMAPAWTTALAEAPSRTACTGGLYHQIQAGPAGPRGARLSARSTTVGPSFRSGGLGETPIRDT